MAEAAEESWNLEWLEAMLSESTGNDITGVATEESSSSQHTTDTVLVNPSVVGEQPVTQEVRARQSASAAPCRKSTCWGAEIKRLTGYAAPCTPGFVPGKGHLKNKFCSACHQSGWDVPEAHLRVPPAGSEGSFHNVGSAGLWSQYGEGVRFRLLNHTQPRNGSRAILFDVPTSSVGWAPTPREWLTDDGQFVTLIIVGGTLAPKGAVRRTHGHAHSKPPAASAKHAGAGRTVTNHADAGSLPAGNASVVTAPSTREHSTATQQLAPALSWLSTLLPLPMPLPSPPVPTPPPAQMPLPPSVRMPAVPPPPTITIPAPSTLTSFAHSFGLVSQTKYVTAAGKRSARDDASDGQGGAKRNAHGRSRYPSLLASFAPALPVGGAASAAAGASGPLPGHPCFELRTVVTVPTSTDADALGSDAVWACAATEADRSSTAAAHSPSTEHDSSEDATDERLAWPPSLPASPAPPPARALDSLPTALYNAVCQLLGYSGKPGLSWALMTLSYCLPALVLDLKDLPWWFHMGAYCLALIWILLVTAGRRLSCQIGLGLFVLFPVQLLFRSLTASAEDLAAGMGGGQRAPFRSPCISLSAWHLWPLTSSVCPSRPPLTPQACSAPPRRSRPCYSSSSASAPASAPSRAHASPRAPSFAPRSSSRRCGPWRSRRLRCAWVARMRRSGCSCAILSTGSAWPRGGGRGRFGATAAELPRAQAGAGHVWA